MSVIPFRLPKLSATMEEGVVIRWLKKSGDAVKSGEALVEVETDKAILEVESPQDGRLKEIQIAEGESVAVGGVLALLEDPSALYSPDPSTGGLATGAPRPAASADQRIKASPAARRRARELDVDLSTVSGSGPGGRILLSDVEDAAQAASHVVPKEPEAVAMESEKDHETPRRAAMRRRLMAQVTKSHREIPTYWSERWVDLELLLERKKLADGLGLKTTVTDYLVQSVAAVLPQHNAMMTRLEEGEAPDEFAEIVEDEVKIGLVVSVEHGLVVPILRNLAGKGLEDLAKTRREAVARARDGRLPQELTVPATISISNGGRDGADRFQAMIYPGQTAILAVGRIHDRVVPMGQAMAVRRGCYLTLTVDHRVVDGLVASAFLGAVAKRIEEGGWPT